MVGPDGAWQPKTIRRFVKAFPSSACTALVETDAGPGYIKALESREGRHILACEWVATQLASWFGLPTFQFALIEVDANDEIPFVDAGGQEIGKAHAGPAFITRQESGEPWSGKIKQLKKLSNPQDISRLVVFDTWTLNCDRYSEPPQGTVGKPRVNWNNVFLSEEAETGKFQLKAMDHTHCFSCGHTLTTKLSNVGRMKDTRVFGLFPEFRDFLDKEHVALATHALTRVDKTVVRSMTQSIPQEWEVSKEVRAALVELIVGRAAFVAETINDKLWPQQEIEFED